jgi:hypothetical protein
MFCPKCGKTITEGLKYCNSCGERLGRVDDQRDTPAAMLGKLLQTISFIALFGFGILIGLCAVLLNNGIRPELVGPVVLAYLATVFGICFPMARQIPKLIDAKIKYWNAGGHDNRPEQITGQPSPLLDEYRSPVMSVTEHTTRTLENVPARKS